MEHAERQDWVNEVVRINTDLGAGTVTEEE
jgi:hypothetical protein